ncbi:hypothetical protein FKG94_03680 [Exilibacterium tricleocarpae]|uniref:Uncharacterized protein n=1 Tax=Exilibacterium tricleocarpae TaxID=2591008 RepID=A0A545U596_9GAMM|nr:hypothetical protein [Exilibacterium tricleocarpae]TQV84634.1 hypothetical protein FKG94_03680 [Exilibacterium tricleocarpae]
MTVAVIELNDADVRLSRDGKLLARQPGYAQINAGGLLLGEAAREQARIHPLQTNNQFWHQLNLDDIASPNPKVRHHGDLAHLQLDQLCEGQSLADVVFAVPGSFTGAQLSLLLGIAHQSPFTTVGMVDSAVAIAAQCAPPGQFTVLDMQLHQTVVTRVEVGDTVVRRDVDSVANAGLLACYERLATLVADQFIRFTRFNPRHDAATEQTLFNQLPDWLTHCRTDSDYEFELEGKSVQLSRNLLLECVAPVYELLRRRVQSAGDGILMNPAAGSLPGLAESWPATHSVDTTAVATACHQLLPHIRQAAAGISFATELPATRAPVTLQRHRAGDRATHLLHRHRAYPLSRGTLYVGGGEQPVVGPRLSADSRYAIAAAAGQWHLQLIDGYTPLVNDKPGTEGAVLQVGDTLRSARDETAMTVISVLPDSGYLNGG